MSSKDLLEIKSLEDLRAAKVFLQLRLKQREADLQERSSRLPSEVVKATIGGIVPFLLNNKSASAVWHLVKGVWTLVFGRKNAKGKGAGAEFVESAKNWGWVTLVKALYGIFTK
jgi:hypothetical protein